MYMQFVDGFLKILKRESRFCLFLIQVSAKVTFCNINILLVILFVSADGRIFVEVLQRYSYYW